MYLVQVGEVVITKDDTLMLNGKGAEAHIAKRVEMLKDQIEVNLPTINNLTTLCLRQDRHC